MAGAEAAVPGLVGVLVPVLVVSGGVGVVLHPVSISSAATKMVALAVRFFRPARTHCVMVLFLIAGPYPWC